MKTITIFFLILLLIIQDISAQNAPVSTLGEIESFIASTTVPVTISGFSNVGSCNLQILYDPAIASCISINLGPGVAGGIATNITVPGVITIGWYTWPGISLDDESVLFDLQFTREDYGITNLIWDNSYNDKQWSSGEFSVLNDTPNNDFYINGSLSYIPENIIRLGIMMFLEGPSSNSEMRTTLNENNLIPLSQPYSGSPWFYSGMENVTEIPEDAVDWVLIEIRETAGDVSTASEDKMIDRKAGFILKDGSVKGLDGSSNLGFPISASENIFIVVYHRNHIAAISASPVPFFNGNGYYNFSNGEMKVFGGNSGHKEITPGTWGLAAGDSNADGIINNLDKQNFWNIATGSQGYVSPDYSMDGQIDNQDKNDIWIMNFNRSSLVPE